MLNLAEKVMLVDLSISLWTARKFDKKITNEVATSHNTTTNAGRYNKNLLPVASSYKNVVTVASMARAAHYEQTLPFTSEGVRILPSKLYLSYMATMRKMKVEYQNAVDIFAQEYPTLKSSALRVLNGLGNAFDYPADHEISKRFGFNIRILPFPSGEALRVNDLYDVDVEALRAEIDEEVKKSVMEAVKEPYRRLLDATTRMAEKLADSEGIFRDSLVNNIESLCEVAEKLNITNDLNLTNIVKAIRDVLLVNPDTLRHSPHTRSNVAAKAAALAQQLEGYAL